MVDSYNFLGKSFYRLPVSELLGHFGEPFPNPKSSLRGFPFGRGHGTAAILNRHHLDED